MQRIYKFEGEKSINDLISVQLYSLFGTIFQCLRDLSLPSSSFPKMGSESVGRRGQGLAHLSVRQGTGIQGLMQGDLCLLCGCVDFVICMAGVWHSLVIFNLGQEGVTQPTLVSASITNSQVCLAITYIWRWLGRLTSSPCWKMSLYMLLENSTNGLLSYLSFLLCPFGNQKELEREREKERERKEEGEKPWLCDAA